MKEYVNIKIEELKRLFASDRLYIELLKDDVTNEELFPKYVEKLYPSKTYNTLDLAEWLEKKDNLIRYYIKSLSDYLQPIKVGRNYKFNYIEIYKCHLVSLYLKKRGRRVSDVREVLFGIEENNNNNNNLSILMEKVGQIERSVEQLVQHSKTTSSGNELDFNDSLLKIEKLETSINKWDVTRKKYFSMEIELEDLKKQFSKLQMEVFDAQKRLLHLESELHAYKA